MLPFVSAIHLRDLFSITSQKEAVIKKKKRLTKEVSITDFKFLMYYTVTKVHIMVEFLDFKCNEIGGGGGMDCAKYNQSF